MTDVADTMAVDETVTTEAPKKTKEPAVWIAFTEIRDADGIGYKKIIAASKKLLMKEIQDWQEIQSFRIISIVRGKEFSVKEKKSYEIM